MNADRRVGRKAIRGRNAENLLAGKYTLDQAFEMFYQAKAVEGLRERTLADYKNHHRYFVAWLNAEYPQVKYIGEITAQILRDYIYYLTYIKPQYDGHPNKSEKDKQKIGLSPACVNVRLTTTKAFYRWLHTEGLIPTNPAANIKKQVVEEDNIGAFTDDQVESLLGQPDKTTYAGFRDYVLMRLLVESGMRINEVLSLNIADIDLQNRMTMLGGSKNKNRKMRIVPLSADMVCLIVNIMEENKSYFPDTKYIFLANYGERLSQVSISHRIKQYGIKAGIADQVRCSPHTFRHTFAKRFLTSGGDIIALQRILGHSSMEMVRKYVQHTPEDLLEAHDRFTASFKIAKRRNV